MSDKQIQQAVVVDIGPGSRMGWVVIEQTRLSCDVGKGAVAVIAQQRGRKPALVMKPGAAQNERIDTAVIVVIGLDHIESTQYPLEAGGLGLAGEGSIALVAEKFDLIADPHM